MAEIQLTTLGRTDLTGPGGRAVLSVLAQPKRFALLVYLAVEGSRGLIRRDTVAALFWPDRDQADARANLRKSLHFLRKSLGRKVVVTRGDEEVGIDASLLRCDAVALLEGGQIPVEGGFLDGFHFSGAPIEWEDWLGSVRERVRACAPQSEDSELPLPAISHEPSEEEHRPPMPGRVRRGRRMVLGTMLLALILLAGLAWGLREDGGFPTTVRYDRIVLGSGVQAPRIVHRHYALPPDGSGILFPDTVDGKWASWWKSMDQLSPSPIPGSALLTSPVFSPDGRWIAFAQDGYLLKQSPDGVTSLVLADSVSRDSSPGIAWLSSGRILFEDANFDLLSLPEEGGAPELVATQEELGHVFHVSGLPDGSGALVVGCVLTCESAVPQLYFVDLQRSQIVPLRSGVWMAWAMADGRVVMVDAQGAVSAASFDPAGGELGQPVPLLNGVKVSPFPEMTLGPDGSLLYIAGGIEPTVRRPLWVERDGYEDPVDPDWPPLWSPRSMSLSPDGSRLAVGMRSDTAWTLLGEQIWIKELSRGPFTPLTVGPHQARRPVWSPDGSTLVFITQFQQEDSTWTSFVSTLPADASSQEAEERLRPARPILEVVLTSDGGTAVVRTGDAATGEGNIAFASLGDAPELQSLLDSRAGEYSLDLSPDDRWLAYVSEVSGRPEVYVRPFPGPGPRVQVTIHGGVEPRWSHSGKELFFRSLGTGGPDPDPPSFMAAEVTTDPVFRVESTTRLFRDRYWRGPNVRLYDVTPDDQRFIVVIPNIYNLTRGAVVYSREWYWSHEVQARIPR